MRSDFFRSLILFSALFAGTAASAEVLSTQAEKYTCPFTQTTSSMQAVKDQLSKFSFQIVEQDTPAKNTLCQNYMNTLQTAREAYSNILRSKSVEASVQSSITASPVPAQEMAALDAQIRMSDSLQGLIGSNCKVSDNQAVSSTALNLIDSIAGTVTLAGLIDPRALLVGVSISAMSRLGVALVNWVMPANETDRDRLNAVLKNDAFLERLCIYRNLAYRVDELDPSTIDLASQKRIAKHKLNLADLEIYHDDGLSCFLRMDEANQGYQKLGTELREILALNQNKTAAEKCTQYVYALEDTSRSTQRVRGGHLFDLVWRIGCEDIGFEAMDPEEAATIHYANARIGHYCKQWRNLLDEMNAVDCFGTDGKAIEKFNATAQFIFDNAAAVGEAGMNQLRDDSPDLYSKYRKLKDQRDLLQAQVQRVEELGNDQSNSLTQVQAMIGNLGNIILGMGLPEYADWNKGEVTKKLSLAQEKLMSVSEGTPKEKCAAGQFATQHLRQIMPRTQSLRKVCNVLGAHGEQPKPPFLDPTRTFSSMIDLTESPLDKICEPRYLDPPAELESLNSKTAESLKECPATPAPRNGIGF